MSKVSVYTNEFESSASAANELVHKIRMGSNSVERFEKTSDSLSSTTASFRLPVSENLLLSRRIVLEVPIRYTVKTTADTMNLANLQVVPRADCMNRLITNCNVRINGSSFVSAPSLFCESVQFYSKDSKALHDGSALAVSPNTPDLKFGHAIVKPHQLGEFDSRTAGVTVGDLAGYHFQKEGYSQMWPSRGSIQPYEEISKAGIVGPTGSGADTNTTVTGGPDPVTGIAGPSFIQLTYLVRYVLKNPILSHSPFECLTNVQEMQIDLTFDSANILHKLFFRHAIRANDTTGPTDIPDAVVGTHLSAETAEVVQEGTKVKLIGYTVSPSNPDQIPESFVAPASEFLVYDYSIGTVATGVKESGKIHTAINVNQVPSAIMLQVVPEEAFKSVKTSDYFALMSNIQVVINNRTYSFQNYNQQDWYNVCSNNGYKGRFEHFDSSTKPALRSQGGRTQSVGVGAPIMLVPSRDLGGSLAEGTIMPFKMEVRFDVTNTSSIPLVSGNVPKFISRVILVMDQKVRITRGMPCTIENGISSQDYAQALAAGNLYGTSEDMEADYDDILGGGRAISSYFRDMGKVGLRSLDVASKVLSAANTAFPEANLGRASDLVNRTNQLATQSGLRDMVGAGMLGGSRYEQLRGMGVLK